MPLTGGCWRADLSACAYLCHCWTTRCHWAGPGLMPRLQTQLTGWESSHFRYSHVFKYSSACSPLSAPCGISSLVRQGRGPVETWETLRGWVKKMCFPPLTGCCSLHRTAPCNRRTQTHLQQVSDERNGSLLWKRILKWLIPWWLGASLKPDSLNSWIHICSA